MFEKYKGRVVEVPNLGRAAVLVNEEFRGRHPLPFRGIVTSVGEPIELTLTGDEFDPSGTKFKIRIKSIDELLRDGTELDEHSHGWTRVCYQEKSNSGFIYASDRTRAEIWAKDAGLSDEQRKMLKPALLVYDKDLIKMCEDPAEIFAAKLPDDPEKRSRAILKVYINNTPEYDLSAPIF